MDMKTVHKKLNAKDKYRLLTRDLAWEPTITMADALKGIFDYYRSQMANAQDLVN